MIVELRNGTGHQTVFPGSTHKDTGERIEWIEDGAPALVDYGVMLTAVQRLAAAALLARRMDGSGAVNNIGSHVIGWLAQCNWTAEGIHAFLDPVFDAIGVKEDDRLRKRIDELPEKDNTEQLAWRSQAAERATRQVHRCPTEPVARALGRSRGDGPGVDLSQRHWQRSAAAAALRCGPALCRGLGQVGDLGRGPPMAVGCT